MTNKEKRERLFDQYVHQPGQTEVTQGKYFFCPQCLRPFEREATGGEQPKLSLAHIIPDSLGGTWVTLACAECNNGNGHQIETELLASLKMSDFALGKSEIKVNFGGVKGRWRRETQGMMFNVTTPVINPALGALKETMKGLKDGSEFKFSFQTFRPDRCWSAICQSAYLLMFRYFGYDFVRVKNYQDLREQSLALKDRVWNGQIFVLDVETAERLLKGEQAAVVLACGPAKAVCPVLGHKSPAGESMVVSVILPGPFEPPVPYQESFQFKAGVVPYDPEILKVEKAFHFLWRDWVAASGIVTN